MAVQNLANHPFHNGLNPTALLHSYSGHSYSEMKLFWGAKGVTLLTSDYMAACGRSRDTLVPALLVPETTDRLPGMLLTNARQNSAPKTIVTKYNSTGDSVTRSEKSASSYE